VVFGVMDGKRGIIKIKAMRKYTCIREKYFDKKKRGALK
jgi:hypothetical protein